MPQRLRRIIVAVSAALSLASCGVNAIEQGPPLLLPPRSATPVQLGTHQEGDPALQPPCQNPSPAEVSQGLGYQGQFEADAQTYGCRYTSLANGAPVKWQLYVRYETFETFRRGLDSIGGTKAQVSGFPEGAEAWWLLKVGTDSAVNVHLQRQGVSAVCRDASSGSNLPIHATADIKLCRWYTGYLLGKLPAIN